MTDRRSIDRSRTLARMTAPLVILRAGGQAAEFVGFVILARRLGTSEFGTVSVAYLICRYGGLIADWGASLKGSRDVAAGRPGADAWALVRRRNIVTAALVGAYIVAAVATGHGALAPLALTIAGRGLNRDWLSLGRERAVRSGTPAALQGLLVAAGAALVTTAAGAAWAIGVGYAVSALVSISLNRLPHRRIGEVPTRSAADPWFLVLLVADQVYASADVILISLLLSMSDAGIYAAVYRFPNAAVTILGLVVTSLVPGLSRAVSGGAQVERLRRRALQVGAVCAALVVAFIPIAWILVPVVYGDAYAPGRPALAILLLATALPALTVGLQPLYFASGKDRSLALYATGVAFLSVGLDLAVIPRFELTGAATVTLLSQTLIAGFYLLATGRHGSTR